MPLGASQPQAPCAPEHSLARDRLSHRLAVRAGRALRTGRDGSGVSSGHVRITDSAGHQRERVRPGYLPKLAMQVLTCMCRRTCSTGCTRAYYSHRMRPRTFERTIKAPVETVWAALTDTNRRAELFSKIDSVEPLTAGPFQLGTRWRETRTVYGRSASADLEVIQLEPFRRFLTESFVGARSTMEYTVVPVQDGAATTVHVTSETTGGGLLYRLVLSLSHSRVMQCIDEQNTQDLADLARACES